MIKKSYQGPKGHHVYCEWIYQEDAQPETTKTVIFLNGLGDSLEEWKKLFPFFQGEAHRLMVDLIGQGRSLTLDREKNLKLDYHISVDEQMEMLRQIVEDLKIPGPFNLIGFSYGGGVALKYASEFPDQVKELILFLPFVIRLDLSFPLQRLWGQQMKFWKGIPGFPNHSMQILEKTYQQFLHQYMHHRYQNRIPRPEDREVAVQLSEGIMNFNGFEALRYIPEESLHLISVDQDTLVPRTLYRELWDRVPTRSKLSWLQIEEGEHLVLEQAPLLVARWIEFLLSQKWEKNAPRKFYGHAQRLEINDEYGHREDLFIEARQLGS